ncbi:hypothetical protein R5R35_010601 [Gryllus longicercus]|uniref:Peptidase S1 domain-containing protein n=1 Tax=Gryllus longicercus TaxID=2509291 RepID=A0AAN9Z290_9ORTH
MRTPSLLIFVVGAVLFVTATVLLYRSCLAQLAETIYETDDTHRPYMVSIEKQGLHHCAGAVVSKRFVLTSAHCFRSVVNYSVRAGSAMAQQGGTQHAIAEIIIHPKYSPFEVEFDVALVKVRPEFFISQDLYPVRLAEFGDPEPADYEAELCGWGHTKDPRERSRALRRVAVHVVPREECAALDPARPPASPLTLCARFTGDSDKDPYVVKLILQPFSPLSHAQ